MRTPSNLFRSWAGFRDIVLDPWVLVLLGASIYFGWSAATTATESVRAALTVIVSVAAGILGARATTRWSALSEESALVARGHVSVRGLKLLLGNILQLQARARSALKRMAGNDDDKQQDTVCLYFEEIIGRANVVAEEALSAIENWTDILPEADVKSQIGVISELSDERDRLGTAIQGLQHQLADHQTKSEAQVAALKQELADKEEALAKTKKELSEKSRGLGFPIASTYSPISATTVELPISSSALLTWPQKRSCIRCGKEVEEQPGVIHFGGYLCDDCRLPSSTVWKT